MSIRPLCCTIADHKGSHLTLPAASDVFRHQRRDSREMVGNAARWVTAPLAQSKPDCCGPVRPASTTSWPAATSGDVKA